MKRAMVWVALVAVAAAGCGKKDETTSQETAKPQEATPAKACDKGQVAKGDQCVAVVTPENVAAVKTQVSKLEELETQLDKVEKLAAVVDLMNALRQLDAWKKATATSDKFKKVDEMVANIEQGTSTFKAFNAQLKSSKVKLADLGTTLQQLYDGSGASKTLAAAQAEVSGQLRAAIEPLQAQVAAAMKAIGPALGELAKLKEIISAVCTLGSLQGGGEDFDKLCATGKDAFSAALTFLETHKDAPKALLGDLVGALESQVSTLMDTEAKKLLDSAQSAVNEAVGEPAPAE